MKKIKIINKTKNIVIAERAALANTFFARLKGLIGKNTLEEDEGLCITPCNSVHMFFMKFSIDVLFIDKDNLVCKTISNLEPWRISPVVRGASCVVELPKDTIEKRSIEKGDYIKIEEV